MYRDQLDLPMNLNASETGIDASGDLSRAGANNQSSGDLNPAVDG